MKLLTLILCVVSVTLSAQTTITLEKKVHLDVKTLIEIDHHKTNYFIEDISLVKMDGEKRYDYSNVQLGEMTSVNVFNPLKINVFYTDFNSVLILDNRLAEITKIDFNQIKPFRLVSHISTGNDTTFWLFNQNTQQLELFDYKTRKTRVTTLPVLTNVKDLKSNFNFVWILTEAFCYKYNYIGSLIEKFPNDGYTKIEENNGDLYLMKDNRLYLKAKNTTNIEPIDHEELLINQFLVTNETLYIYDGEFLHQYHLKLN
ncbi:MAG: hypothetical protein KJO41_01060 [Bacteroidia bacterium]|nr:hypothetical protein [Bacteroidia bacterium]MBT8277560.1 hypothetical protein [Bacteroidia bacterium]NND25784.1 hypothetical protein [Flavobacteriaceae bacterium]NNK59914.1 hypothetical protein [Flavobacteriaceae bacterium]NNL32782.1 hypothetical protein [Flavobacteriaceae bacterium]